MRPHALIAGILGGGALLSAVALTPVSAHMLQTALHASPNDPAGDSSTVAQAVYAARIGTPPGPARGDAVSDAAHTANGAGHTGHR